MEICWRYLDLNLEVVNEYIYGFYVCINIYLGVMLFKSSSYLFW